MVLLIDSKLVPGSLQVFAFDKVHDEKGFRVVFPVIVDTRKWDGRLCVDEAHCFELTSKLGRPVLLEYGIGCDPLDSVSTFEDWRVLEFGGAQQVREEQSSEEIDERLGYRLQ